MADSFSIRPGYPRRYMGDSGGKGPQNTEKASLLHTSRVPVPPLAWCAHQERLMCLTKSLSTYRRPLQTAVNILDFDETSYVNYEAEVHFKGRAEGVVQVENFGVHVSESGFVAYGLRVDAVMDRIRTGER